MVYRGQAIFYVVRERERMWRARPGNLLMLGTLIELTIFSALAVLGVLMAPLSRVIMLGVLGGSVVLSFVLDSVKLMLFRYLPIIRMRSVTALP